MSTLTFIVRQPIVRHSQPLAPGAEFSISSKSSRVHVERWLKQGKIDAKPNDTMQIQTKPGPGMFARGPQKSAQNGSALASAKTASAGLEELMRKAVGAAGCADVAAFKRLPASEQNDFLAQARGAKLAQGTAGEQSRPILLAHITRSLTNRETFDPEKMAELVESVRTHGVMEPIIVRPVKDGEWFVDPVVHHGSKGARHEFQVISRGWVEHMASMQPGQPASYWSGFVPARFITEIAAKAAVPRYEIVMGERRWRAAKEAGLTTIPAIVKTEMSDGEALEWQLTENLQREDLRPLDEARGYQQLMALGYTVEDLVPKLHRSKSSIYGRLKLLELPDEARAAVEAGKLPASHAELITRIDDPTARQKLAKELLKPVEDWSGGPAETISFREAKEKTEAAVAALAKEKKWEEETAEYRAEGLKVLTLTASGRVFQYGRLKAEYVGANDKCDLDPQGRTWKALLTKLGEEGTALVARNEYGAGGSRVRVVFARKGADKALRAGGLVSAQAAKINAAEQRKREEERAEAARAEKEARDHVLIAQIVAAAEAREPNAETWRFMAEELMENLAWGMRGVLQRRGVSIDEKMNWPQIEKAGDKLLDTMDGKRLRGLVVELMLWRHGQVVEARMEGAAALYKIKVQASGKGKGGPKI